ncbi:MAG: two-component system response regulator [Alphaproteobacteria bacterium RIFOXYD12_FULL_60_8]|nr:MAG: two-component system response regulator [Alphaproteobacteria bacterium RIFOXYD12_FULL_60_8]
MVAFNGNEFKVLVVEDNQHFRLLIKTVLQALGIREVEEAVNGLDAIDCLKKFQADLVIADWKMAPMDGIEFTHFIRKDNASPNPYLPVIMVTGFAEAKLVVEARDAGVNEFLAKPISAKMLMSRILAVVQKPRPFVKAGQYFGPDRRRKPLPFKGDDRRKKLQ